MLERINEIHDTIGEKVKELARTETIIGKPMQVGETSIIPVVSIMAGWGAGIGVGKAAQEAEAEGGGGGGGGGVRITPVAFIVVKGTEVSLLTLREARLSKMAEIIPTVVEAIRGGKRKGEAADDEGSNTEGE